MDEKGRILKKSNVYRFWPYLNFPVEMKSNFFWHWLFSLLNLAKTELLPIRNCWKSIISESGYFEMCHFQVILCLPFCWKIQWHLKKKHCFWEKNSHIWYIAQYVNLAFQSYQSYNDLKNRTCRNHIPKSSEHRDISAKACQSVAVPVQNVLMEVGTVRPWNPAPFLLDVLGPFVIKNERQKIKRN